MSCFSQVICESTKTTTDLWGNSLCNPQQNIQQSVVFMKQLTVIALSNITYLRNVFPESAFGTRYMSGMPIRILQNDIDEPLPIIDKMMSFVKSALEALAEKYLHKMIFVIEDLEFGNMEVYTLNFKYNYPIDCDIRNENGDMVISSQNSDTPEDIKTQTQDLLRRLYVLISSKQQLLSTKLSMHFRLVLNEDAPEDYQLERYYNCDEISRIDSPDGIDKLKFGKINTYFHALTTNYHICHEVVNKDNETDNENLQRVNQSMYQIEEDANGNENPSTENMSANLIKEVANDNENPSTEKMSSTQILMDDATDNENLQRVDQSEIESDEIFPDLFKNEKPKSKKRSSFFLRKTVEGGIKKRRLRY